MRPRLNLQDTAIVIALGIGATLFWYFRLILPATEMHAASWDLYTEVYPMAQRAADWIRKGHVPLWNPLQLCGQPFLASVLYGIFYPLNFPHLLFPTAVALELIIILHLFLAGAFTYAYARSIGVTRYGAAAAGIVFMLSGFVTSQALWVTEAVNAIVWLPLGLLGVEWIFARRSFGGTALLACAVAMPVLAGWLQTWTYSMHAIVAYAAVRLLLAASSAPERRTVLRAAVLLGSGFALGLCLACVQLLPSMELQSLGPRRPGGLSLTQMLTMGPVAPGKLLADAVDSRPGFPRQMYVGMLPLLLMPLSWLAPSGRGRVVFLWCAGIWSIVVAMTVYTPAFTLFRALPGGAWFRVPWRIVFIYVFAAAVLTGIGLDTLGRAAASARERRVWWPIGLLTSAAVLCVALISMPGLSLAYVVATVALGWVVWLARTPRARAATRMALLIFLSCDLFMATRSPALHPFHDLTVYDRQHEVFDYISEVQGFYRTYIHWAWPGSNPALMPKQGTLRTIFSITDYEPLSLDRYAKFYQLLDARPEWDPTLLPFAGFLELNPSPAALRLLDLMSVRYIVTSPSEVRYRDGLQGSGLPWHRVFSTGANKYVVYANDQVLPRAYVAHTWSVAPNGEQALQWIAADTFDRWRTVVIESEEAATAAGATNLPITPSRITTYQPTRVEIEAEAAAPGYVVLTDTFYPGWKAMVDGTPAVIDRANFLFRAVQVPAGRHLVTFTYDPQSFKVGLGLTLAAIAVLAAWGMAVALRTARWKVGREPVE